MSLKSELQEIATRLVWDSEDFWRGDTEKTLGEVAEPAIQAILDLLDKSLPKELNSFPNERDVDEMAGYNAALADVRKVIKEDK